MPAQPSPCPSDASSQEALPPMAVFLNIQSVLDPRFANALEQMRDFLEFLPLFTEEKITDAPAGTVRVVLSTVRETREKTLLAIKNAGITVIAVDGISGQ